MLHPCCLHSTLVRVLPRSRQPCKAGSQLCTSAEHKGIVASVQEVLLPPFLTALLMRSMVPVQIGYEDKNVEAMACKTTRACAKSFPCKVFQVGTARLSCH